jgi:hypothetical protein
MNTITFSGAVCQECDNRDLCKYRKALINLKNYILNFYKDVQFTDFVKEINLTCRFFSETLPVEDCTCQTVTDNEEQETIDVVKQLKDKPFCEHTSFKNSTNICDHFLFGLDYGHCAYPENKLEKCIYFPNNEKTYCELSGCICAQCKDSQGCGCGCYSCFDKSTPLLMCAAFKKEDKNG